MMWKVFHEVNHRKKTQQFHQPPFAFSGKTMRKTPQQNTTHISHLANGPWKKKFELYFAY